MSVRERIATPEGKGRYVRTLFATIADRYDLITVLLSFGRDQAWKARLVADAGVVRGTQALDLATGTGDIAWRLHAAGATVVGLDLTPRMIELACAKRVEAEGPRFLVGDMGALPFASASFDLVTTGYGLRNTTDLPRALDEIRRVLKPGGLLLSLDFNRPEQPLMRAAYLGYLSMVGGALGWVLHRDPDTYRYIPASIRAYPGGTGVVRLLQARGFREAAYLPVLGGFMAIHRATTAPAPQTPRVPGSGLSGR